jgi:hypothetical protein
MIQIEIQDNKIVNLKELMKNCQWEDFPSDEAICCFSFRKSIGKIDNRICSIVEFSKCMGYPSNRIVIKDLDTKEDIGQYYMETEYYRNSHNKKTYYRSDVDDLRIKEPREYNE